MLSLAAEFRRLIAARSTAVVQRVDFPIDIALVFDLRIDGAAFLYPRSVGPDRMLFSLIQRAIIEPQLVRR